MGEIIKDNFHIFCENRMITIETELRFKSWFADYLGKHFIYNDKTFLRLLRTMPIVDITQYWKLFIDGGKSVS